ncbi:MULTISPECIES: hypothetical protein [unclassified Phaeobacter]|uniref:hypothetical protein n=1 Tax=unclassified Phaeobacter TaxID=2621772 RepID=UPI003A88E9A9
MSQELDRAVGAFKNAVAAGDDAAAKKIARAIKAMQSQAPAAPQTGTKPSNAPAVPEGFFVNPDTGQMTSRELLTGHHRQNNSRGGAIARMAPHGATLGLSDEAAWVGERLARGPDAAKFAMENERAKIEGYREDFPYSSFLAEMGGGLAVPASVVQGGAKAVGAGQAVRKAATAGAVTGALYGAGEGEGLGGRSKGGGFGLIGGAAGGVASVPLAKVVIWAANKAGKPVARLFSDRRYYTPDGGITQAGRTALRQLGYDADELSDAFAREFSKGVDNGVDPTMAARAAEMGEFGIPAYKQNVSGDVNDFANFERARRGVGPEPMVKRAQELGSAQELAARRAPDEFATEMGGGIRGDQFDAAEAVSNRLTALRGEEEAAAQAAYRAADEAGVSVPAEVATGVTQRVQTRLADEEIDLTSDIFKNARSFMSRLQKRGEGEGGVSLRLIDTFRKDLNRTMSRAESEDLRALAIIKKEYDDWIDDIVSAKLFDGDEAGFEDLKNARQLWQAYAQKFQGRDAGARFIRDMIDQDASPDQVMKWMFGASKLGGGRMNANLAGTLRGVLGENSPEWGLVRQAAFRQLTQKPGTEQVGATGAIPWGPQKVSENILSFVNGPQSRPLANALFTGQERAKMLRLAGALRKMVPPAGAVNHSGTAYESAKVAQKSWEAVAAMIGFKAGGPAGAVGGREFAKSSTNGAAWLRSRRLGRIPQGAKSIGAPATGAIPAAQVAGSVTGFQSQNRQE